MVPVGYGKKTDLVTRAIRWDNDGSTPVHLEALGLLDSDTSSAYGNNSVGNTVGGSSISGQTHAFRTIPNQPIVFPGSDLGTFSGGSYSFAYAINDLGEVVGAANKSDGFTRAFRTGRFTVIDNPATKDIGFLPGNFSSANGINNVGQVVGYSTDGTGTSRAFLYQNGWSAIKDLNGLLYPDTFPWQLRSAEAIDDDGRIVGWGLYNTLPQAFLIDPNK